MTDIDMDGRYRVDGWPGIAVWVKQWPYIERDYDFDLDEYFDFPHDDRAIVVMVGDNREHMVDVDDLTKIEDDDYCHSCGQIGCGHDGIDRD